ncbi:hypothetical protein Q5P01_002388 [Channa striata]|uniref:Uncharacterized protein n=1 Tax=Channa striata TaxID=64152 RepID=A0AA88NP46_CHASR|nr:hypothetical protein Q5P01_002388 [Channa striata]
MRWKRRRSAAQGRTVDDEDEEKMDTSFRVHFFKGSRSVYREDGDNDEGGSELWLRERGREGEREREEEDGRKSKQNKIKDIKWRVMKAQNEKRSRGTQET